jgi:HK97 family phage major capsid protein
MKKAKQLREERATKVTAMQALLDKASADNKRTLTTEERSQWKALDDEIIALDGELVIAERQETLNLEMASRQGQPLAGQPAGAPVNKRQFTRKELLDLSTFSMVRGLQLLAQGKPLDGVEKEVHEMAVKQARSAGVVIEGFAVPAFIGQELRGETATGQTTNAGDQGGLTIATEVNALIEALWANNFLSEVGARRFAGLVGNQTFPVQLTKPTAEAVSEIATLTDQEILFGHVDMAPNRRGATIPVSKQLLLQSSFDVQAFVIDQIRRCLDYKLNSDAVTAILAAITSGNGNLDTGATNGQAPTYAQMVGLETLIAASDADKGSLKYLVNPKVRGKLKLTEKFTGTIGASVWEPSNLINSYPAVVSTIVPSNLTKGTASGVASAIIFGNFNDFYFGMWGGVDFVVDPYTLAKKAQIQITANMWWDTKVARAASFAGIKDVLTT